MIPPQLMGLAAKLLGVLALIVALIGVGEWHGRRAKDIEHAAEISRQAIASGENIIKNAENTAREEAHTARIRQEQTQRTRIVEKDVIKYVESPGKKCEVSPELERIVDAISASGVPAGAEPVPDPPAAPVAGGLHDASTADGLPASASAAGELAASPDARLTDAEILQAYAYAAEQYYTLRDTYHALVEWVETSYAIAKEGAGR